MKANLPIEFAPLAGRVDYVQRISAHEWSSSCPQCGGTVKKGGELPDRFRMWTNATGRNKVFAWCRKCSFIWSPRKERAMSSEDFEKWRKEQIVIEEERKREAEHALKILRSEKIWEFYHANRGEYGVEYWEKRGIPAEWQNYWRLGMYGNYAVAPDYHSPAATIPMWYENWEVFNVKLRVLNPRNDSERYRAIYKTGLKTKPFIAFPDLVSKSALVTEGEIKAMVCAVYKSREMQVIGLPSSTPDAQALTDLRKYDTIYLNLDPDARVSTLGGKNPLTPERRIIDIVGAERVRLVHLHDKVDDLILKYGLNIDSAVKVAKPC